jgi:hypothetical protein
MAVDKITGKITSGMDKFDSIVDRMYMKLGSKFFSSLRVKIQLLKKLQCVIVVDGATRSKKDVVEGNGGSLKDGAEALCCSFVALSWFCGLVSSLYLISMRSMSSW